MKLGDAVAKVAEPIARAVDSPCIDPATGHTRPESRCGRMKKSLNDFSDSVYDVFWPNTNREENDNG